MAAAVANRDVIYYTFGDKKLAEEIASFHNRVIEKGLTVGDLWKKIEQFDPEFGNLFESILEASCIII